jgi:hypothetical protein
MSKSSKKARLAVFNAKKARRATINTSCAYNANRDAWNDVLDLVGPKKRCRQSSDDRIDNAIRVEFSTHNKRHQSKFGLAGRTKQYSKERITAKGGVRIK